MIPLGLILGTLHGNIIGSNPFHEQNFHKQHFYVRSMAGVARGDCYRGGGAAEMAVRDYKRALEVEPSNWMVKTRLSLAHYLKVRGCIFLALCQNIRP